MCNEQLIDNFTREPRLEQNNERLRVRRNNSDLEELKNAIIPLISEYGEDEDNVFRHLLFNRCSDYEYLYLRLLTIFCKNIAYNYGAVSVRNQIDGYRVNFPQEIGQWFERGDVRERLFQECLLKILDVTNVSNLHQLNSRNLSQEFINKLIERYDPNYKNTESKILPYLKTTISGKIQDSVKRDINNPDLIRIMFHSSWWLLEKSSRTDLEEAAIIGCVPSIRYSTIQNLFKLHYGTMPKLVPGQRYREPTNPELENIASEFNEIISRGYNFDLEDNLTIDANWIRFELKEINENLRTYYTNRSRNIQVNEDMASIESIEDSIDLNNNIKNIHFLILQILEKMESLANIKNQKIIVRKNKVLTYMYYGFSYTQNNYTLEQIGKIVGLGGGGVISRIKTLEQNIVKKIIANLVLDETMNSQEVTSERVETVREKLKKNLPETYRQFTFKFLSNIQNNNVAVITSDQDFLINEIENFLMQELKLFESKYNYEIFQKYSYIVRENMQHIIQQWHDL
ncbi:hypothetical protein Sta7437_4602 (plasmid) [Stanieria cyanosphaera PCC 7437]|uniref:Uncharacterized protein n=2 Tax=Stanieria cyanosphaera TaxID=102116 RepID=K9XZQ2_STAC7|nr:hypothetical protein Sta7437_4602 [Stanieria cyanosphaera PCC 7437]